MPLLDVQNLSIRFGGLTAVSNVDLKIEQGQIYSVIGPNGAGKTTVFNAITGIYEPTDGAILFDGQSLERRATWRVFLFCALVGIVTALTAVAVTANIDDLWRATIKRNYSYATQTFQASAAWRDFWNYLRGDLAVELQPRGRWAVVMTNGQPVLGSTGNQTSRAAAEKLADQLRELVASGKTIEPVQRGEKWAILSADGQNTLAEYSTQDNALRAASMIGEIREDQTKSMRREWIALVAGFVLGAAGTWVVWQRARRTPDVISLAGIARTFQNIRLFPDMTVLENVLVGLDRSQSHNTLSMALHTPGIRRQEKVMRERAREALKFVDLQGKANSLASSLAYGDQRRLEIARALATGPKLLLLDEPAAGMNPTETTGLMQLIRRIRDLGTTVLLIEHHMNVVMGISDRIAVLNYGQRIAEGTPEAVRCDPKVIEAYLGTENQ